jgi:hypothetical protein
MSETSASLSKWSLSETVRRYVGSIRVYRDHMALCGLRQGMLGPHDSMLAIYIAGYAGTIYHYVGSNICRDHKRMTPCSLGSTGVYRAHMTLSWLYQAQGM